MKRKQIIILTALIFIFTFCAARAAGPPPPPRPPVPELKHDMTDRLKGFGEFDRIEMSGPFDVKAKIGPKHEWIVSAPAHLVPYVHCAVEDRTLVIKPKDPHPPSVFASAKILVKVTAPQIISLDMQGSGDAELRGKKDGFFELKNSGSGDAVISGEAEDFDARIFGSGDLNAKNFSAGPTRVVLKGSGDALIGKVSEVLGIELAGSGGVKVKELRTETLTVRVFGSGGVNISDGETDKAEYATSGSGSIDAAKVEAGFAVATVKGNGDISLRVKDSLTARVTGSGDITYYGDPKEKAVFEQGSGKIRQKK